MIEKPKRPKQPNIQDRQPPRTLQELINRYDLDNTKIYDFLDGLVELLNTEKKSIDTSINDLNNNKVNKSGDSMAGALLMQGNPIGFGNGGNIYFKEDGYGDKFRILPYFSGAGSANRLVIQSTTGGAGEDPQNWKDLVTIHADSGQVDLIHPTNWSEATLSSGLEGKIIYAQIGNVVIVNFIDFIIRKNIASYGEVLATGLPKSSIYLVSALSNYDYPSTPMRIGITNDGSIQTHYSNTIQVGSGFYGTIVYITNQ